MGVSFTKYIPATAIAFILFFKISSSAEQLIDILTRIYLFAVNIFVQSPPCVFFKTTNWYGYT